MKASRTGSLVFQLAISILLLWLAFKKVDVGTLTNRVGSLRSGWTAVAILTLFCLVLLTGIRWYFVDRSVGAGITSLRAMRLMLVGHLFSQLLPSSVGGDGVRAWLLSREGVPIRRALASVICDRVVALVVLTAIVACTLPIVIFVAASSIPSALYLSIVADTLVISGLVFLYLFGDMLSLWLFRFPWVRPIGVIIRDLTRVLFTSDVRAWVVNLSILAQAILISGIYFCALALSVRFSPVHLLILPLIMLVSSIPISFAGWGLRESAMVTGLGYTGISAGDALAVSVIFGIAQLVVGFPGLVIVVMSKYAGRNSEFQTSR